MKNAGAVFAINDPKIVNSLNISKNKRIDAVTKVSDPVAARSAIKNKTVGAGPAHHHVTALAALQKVPAGATKQPVGAPSPIKMVSACTAVQHIPAFSAT